MGILENFENAWDLHNEVEEPNLAAKIFSEEVCSECESKHIPITDNMGREMFWNDAGRPENP
jgi:hypothetical protein